MAHEGEKHPVPKGPSLVLFIDGLAAAFAAPPSMFVDLILGGFTEAVSTKLTPTGDMRTRAAAVAVKGPEFDRNPGGREIVCALEGHQIAISRGELALKCRIQIRLTEVQ